MKETDTTRQKHLDINWELRFQQLLQYNETKGDCNVPRSFNSQLGQWVIVQRQMHKRNKLSNERQDMLDSIGFVWHKRDAEDWDFRFEQLVQYKRTHGSCDVQESNETNQELGRWVKYQRFFKGQNSLRKARVDKLESIGFIFSQKFDWDFHFEQLVEYKRTHGTCDVPFHYKVNQELGRWVSNQRFLEGQNKLRKDRVAKLESRGFRFATTGEAKKCDDWDIVFEELHDYLRDHGDCDVPEKYPLNPLLGEWVRKQRRGYSLKCGGDQSVMTAEHEAKLNVLGFLWEKRQTLADSNVNNVLYPEKVTSESLTPMNRQRTALRIPTEIRSNDSSCQSGR
jgi:hypothetical protein